jgi:hypothetical protein
VTVWTQQFKIVFVVMSVDTINVVDFKWYQPGHPICFRPTALTTL